MTKDQGPTYHPLKPTLSTLQLVDHIDIISIETNFHSVPRMPTFGILYSLFYFQFSLVNVSQQRKKVGHVSWPGGCWTVESPGAEDGIYTSILQVRHCTLVQSGQGYLVLL